eukprot:TRINITY_DN15046_c0_g1_i2.p1 TRINITY_DN15046_c0_g1~~TRINITY_DN15046_c0_g1_i2.p1  ORF type:complete len:531 (+),score=61.31 TRINITY_DN15046_c0_g1_i2:38-1594(+)
MAFIAPAIASTVGTTLLGLVMPSVRQCLKQKAGDADEKPSLHLWGVLLFAATSEIAEIQDGVRLLQQQSLRAAQSWFQFALAALEPENPERFTECMRKVEECSVDALPALSEAADRVDCYALIAFSGFYNSSQGGRRLDCGMTHLTAVWQQICADRGLWQALCRAGKARRSMSLADRRLLEGTVQLQRMLTDSPVYWTADAPEILGQQLPRLRLPARQLLQSVLSPECCVLRYSDAPVLSLCVCKGRLYSGSKDGFVLEWDVNSGEVRRLFLGHAQGVWCLVRDGDTLISGGDDAFIITWDLESGTPAQQLTCPEWVLALQPTPFGLFSGHQSGDIFKWSQSTVVAKLEGHRGWVTGLALDHRARLCSSAQDGTVRIWDSETTQLLSVFRLDCWPVCLFPLGDMLFTGNRDGSVSLRAGNETKVFCEASPASVLGLLISEESARLYTAGHDGVVREWDMVSERCTGQFLGHKQSVRAMTWFDNKLVTASYDATIRVWRPKAKPKLLLLAPAPSRLLEE